MLDTIIVGAGPYGLSLAAHLRHHGVPFRIFGRPMDSWRAHMPKGMLLKSDGFASNISHPEGQLTLGRFCAERGIPYSDSGTPVSLDTFTQYGLTFRDRCVPELENRLVVNIECSGSGYRVTIDDGELVEVRRVVFAVGITHFEHIPDNLAHLTPEFLSHSARHSEVGVFSGRDVVVIGGGSSALDWAALLHEAGINVQLVARRGAVKFHGKRNGKPRSLWTRIQHPQTGLGPGWRSSFYANAPSLFRYLPEGLRLEIVKRTLGPSGGWFIKDKVVGKVPMLLGHSIENAEIRDGKVLLTLRDHEGKPCRISADHIIAATGYKVELNRLTFVSPELRSTLKAVNGTPVLSADFESSVPGIYFIGIAASNSFGPVMRFAYGADFAARTIARALTRSGVRKTVSETPPAVTTVSK